MPLSMLKPSDLKLSGRVPFISLFLVSLASIAFEISLTRYFAVANWSEYGYWVISIAMTGYSVSGVLLTLFKDFLVKRASVLFFVIPVLLMISASAGYFATCVNPFNPLELQNEELWRSQLVNIGTYYLTLFPVFFLSGLYIGLNFIIWHEKITLLYGYDLVGAGFGAILMLCAMFFVHPFYLPAVIMPFWLITCFLNVRPLKAKPVLLLLCVFVFIMCEWTVVHDNRADYFQYKTIYTALNVEGNRVNERIKSPKGYFHVLSNFTERPDVPLSNNYSLLGVKGPPLSYGLYKDGTRITSLPKQEPKNNLPYIGYAKAALDAFPYALKKYPAVLLIGASGGFKIRESLILGASPVTAIEPDTVIYGLLSGNRYGDALRVNKNVTLILSSPQSFLAKNKQYFDIIDIASDFMDESDSNRYAFTVEAFREYLRSLRNDGVLSVPVSIKEFTVYALKLVETIREALRQSGISEPEKHILVYRSAWSVRILVSVKPFTPSVIKKLRAFCDDRSFDTSYFPGIENEKVEIYNDLPSISIEEEKETSSSGGASDALKDDILKQLGRNHEKFLSDYFFNVSPATNDRPFFYSILRLSKLKSILSRISLIPKEEIGELINMAVLLQSALFALLILFLPALARFSLKGRGGGVFLLKSIVYFSCLGLSFLFLEIILIAKFTYFLNDSTSSFAVVLSSMLIFSGLGSFFAGRFVDAPQKGVRVSVCVILLSIGFYFMFMNPILLIFLNAPFPVKIMLICVLVASLSFVMGFPFSLGLSALKGERASFVPWAWALNGAFSVVSTPIVNLLSVSYGYTAVFILSAALYMLVLFTFPVGADKK